MKKRKTTVFWVINIELLLLFILVIFFAPDMISVIGPFLGSALVANGAVYITGNVAHAWQKSKYYQPVLDDKNDSEMAVNYSKRNI